MVLYTAHTSKRAPAVLLVYRLCAVLYVWEFVRDSHWCCCCFVTKTGTGGFVSLLSWPLSHFLSAVPRTWWSKVAITQPSITIRLEFPPPPSIHPFAGLFNRWCQPARSSSLFIFFLSWLTRASSSYILGGGWILNIFVPQPTNQPTPPALNKTYMCVYCIYILSLSLFPLCCWRLSTASSEVFLFNQVCRQTLSAGKKSCVIVHMLCCCWIPSNNSDGTCMGRKKKN